VTSSWFFIRQLEEIPVRCYMLWLVDVYFIHVALVLLLMFIWLLCFRFPRYTDFNVRSTSRL